jgi:hypothetical protein
LRLLSSFGALKNAFKNKDLQRSLKGSGEESAYLPCNRRPAPDSVPRGTTSRGDATSQAKLNSIAPSGP